jgi:hypothetical protein
MQMRTDIIGTLVQKENRYLESNLHLARRLGRANSPGNQAEGEFPSLIPPVREGCIMYRMRCSPTSFEQEYGKGVLMNVDDACVAPSMLYSTASSELPGQFGCSTTISRVSSIVHPSGQFGTSRWIFPSALRKFAITELQQSLETLTWSEVVKTFTMAARGQRPRSSMIAKANRNIKACGSSRPSLVRIHTSPGCVPRLNHLGTVCGKPI